MIQAGVVRRHRKSLTSLEGLIFFSFFTGSSTIDHIAADVSDARKIT